MRHRHGLRKLNRTTSHRLAMLRNMTNSLFTHEAIKTTLPKAKELRRVAEPLITLGKTPTLANRRLAFDRLRDRDVVTKLFNDLGPRFKARPGGYLRILKFGFRQGDNAPMALVELVDRPAPAADARDGKGSLTIRPGDDPGFASLDAGLLCPAFFWVSWTRRNSFVDCARQRSRSRAGARGSQTRSYGSRRGRGRQHTPTASAPPMTDRATHGRPRATVTAARETWCRCDTNDPALNACRRVAQDAFCVH